jgi:sporulation protein YlmC with PRC-barrel domain
VTAGSDAVDATGAEGTGTDGTTMATGDNSTDSTPGMAREGYATLTGEALTADALGSADIYDQQDQQIGSVSDLVLDDSGQITQVVVDVGGFLGIGAKSVALPINEIEILQAESGNEVRIYVPHTREQLEAMPQLEG